MKISFLLLFLTAMTAASVSMAGGQRPHLEMELRSSDYMKLLARQRTQKVDARTKSDQAKLKPVLDLGQRNLEFLTFINSQRDAGHKISLSAPETEQAFPINSPNVYNADIAYQRYAALLKAMPAALANIITKNEPFPTSLPLPEKEYIKWGLETDHVYQLAARWLTLSAYLPSYAEAQRDDIRGFYYLSGVKDLPQQLAHWKELPANVQAQYREWLIGTCFNSQERSRCENELGAILAKNGNVMGFFSKYAPASQQHYQEYFQLQWPRRDITFSRSQPEVLKIPFVDPKNAAVFAYLKNNIEDEYRWEMPNLKWHLQMDFGNFNSSSTAHVRWQSGVTPHVELPNTIVMDQNQPITEYESQWTIRHEFGHVLGLPDCYIEFYDTKKSVMTGYQLDITNLMCSRRGKFKQVHFDELKRVYYK